MVADDEPKLQEVRVPRQKIPRQIMPEQAPEVRITNFNEVALGFSPELALKEATRCIQCKKLVCVEGCPVGIDIPGFIKLIREEHFIEAAHKIKEANSLPAMCGRVCPQEDQCEKECLLGIKGQPMAIGALERFAADYERDQGAVEIPSLPEKTGRSVAVIGSGPGGLTCAGDLAKLGHEVTIFEGLHKAGGVLVYGIPEFRLPKAIVEAEVDYLKQLGVKLEVNKPIGRIASLNDLFNSGFDAVFIGTGAGLPLFLHIPGENLNGVYSANEYLTRSNLMKAYLFPQHDTPIIRARRVAVIGGGNIAMDAARTALRLGAEAVYLIYRRSRDEMPARRDEVLHAQEEGVKFMLLWNPVEVLGNADGWVSGLRCIHMELGEPDESGRRRPVPVKGSEFEIPIDALIVAIGNGPNPILLRATPDLALTEEGTLRVNPETLATSMKGVYAGGDIVTGAATVIQAMGHGKIAARSIDSFLRNETTQ